MGANLNLLTRPGSISNRDLNVDVFPFDAFEFDDPNRVSKPSLTMKDPWNLKIGNSELPWTEEKHGIIPSNGWFAKFIALNETTLESETSITSVEPSYNNLKSSSYGVNGTVKFDFTDFPVDFTNYTIIYRHQNAWQYKTSGGISVGFNIDVTGDLVTLWSNFPYMLPFTLSYTSQSFREVLIIPENYSQATIDEIINDSDTFISYFSTTGGNPSLTLSSQGMLWKSGDSYIRLGETASFHGVDLDSGNFQAGVQGWQITKEGNAEFNDGTFRGTLDGVNGTFSGDLEIGADDADRQLSLGSKGLLVKDSLGSIIHDLPTNNILSGVHHFGHKYNQEAHGTLSFTYVNFAGFTPLSYHISNTLEVFSIEDLTNKYTNSDNIKAITIRMTGILGMHYLKHRVASGSNAGSQITISCSSKHYTDASTSTSVATRTTQNQPALQLRTDLTIDIPISYDNNYYLECQLIMDNMTTVNHQVNMLGDIRLESIWV